MRMRTISAIALTLIAGAAQAQADLFNYLGGQGCIIGPATAEAAGAAGFTVDDVQAAVTRSAPLGNEWYLLPPELCTIRFPDIDNAIPLDDPDLLAAFAQDPELGCFLAFDRFRDKMQSRRGWDDDRLNAEYLRVLAAGIIAGDIRYYSEDMSQTPMGAMLMTGACGDVPEAAAIRASHDVLRTYFDSFIRAYGQTVSCHRKQAPNVTETHRLFDELSGGQNSNFMIGFEAHLIGIGAGWSEGVSATDRGYPAPPLCRFD